MNAFFSFVLFLVYMPECKQHNTRRYVWFGLDRLHTLNLGCSCITLREPCNNQQSRCGIAWLHAQIMYTTHTFSELNVKQSNHIQKSWVVCSFAYPRWRFLQARYFHKYFLKKYFVQGCGHFSEVKYLTLHR